MVKAEPYNQEKVKANRLPRVVVLGLRYFVKTVWTA